MKYLVIFSTLLSIVLCYQTHLNDRGYRYYYSSGRSGRSEIHYPNGEITGAFEFFDGQNQRHYTKYVTGNQPFKIISHEIENNGQKWTVSNEIPAEFQQIKKSHLKFEDALQAVLPQIQRKSILVREISLPFNELNAKALPPVYVRHVPSPVKEEPDVPIIEVAPPLKAQVIQHSHLDAPVVTAQGYYEDIKPEPEKKEYKHPSNNIYITSSIPDLLKKNYEYQVEEKSFPQKVHKVHEQQVYFPSPKLQHISTIEYPEPPAFHTPSAVHPPISFEYQYHTERPLLAADVPLTDDGLTLEVASARDRHFAAIEAVKAHLSKNKSNF